MKRFVKIFLYALLGVILVVILGSYISYSTYWAKDPAVETDSSNLVYFHDSYEECRTAFIRSIDQITHDFDRVETGKILVPSDSDDDLSIDWCYIPAQKTRDKLLIINSGLHGIEGFTGSAIQIMFIEKILVQQLPDNIGILFMHGLNPYGFKYRRKVTGQNVDLNRNCLEENQSFDIKNKGYEQLTDMLMPSKPVNPGNLRNRFFYLIAIYKIVRESLPVLRQAALQGQYDFQKGIYYGGKTYEPQIESIKPILIDRMKEYKTVLTVDLHTGYGSRGALHLFIDKPDDEAIQNGMESIFRGAKIDWGSSADFYTITGEYANWVGSLVPDVLSIPMLFEFGTLNSQETFGSIKSMQIMILENQGAHYGYKNEKSEAKVKHLFDELYYPSSPVWRSKVIADAYEMMSMMMENYKGFE